MINLIFKNVFYSLFASMLIVIIIIITVTIIYIFK